MNKNCFELLNLEIHFNIDKGKLEENYTAFSAKFHPDNFETKEEIFHATNLILELNSAYAIIKDDIKRAKCILQLYGIILDGVDKNITPDIDFLEKIMELSEQFLQDKNKNIINLKISQNMDLLEDFFIKKDFKNAGKTLLNIIYLQGILHHNK